MPKGKPSEPRGGAEAPPAGVGPGRTAVRERPDPAPSPGEGPRPPPSDLQISAVEVDQRVRYAALLDASFTGMYRRHARRMLPRVPWVRGADLAGRPVGVSLLDELTEGVGYVFYLAVEPGRRLHGIGGALLDDALAWFRRRGLAEALAAVESDNVESRGLFRSRGFEEVSRSQFDRVHGLLRAIELRYRMLLVPGERLLRREIGPEGPGGRGM